jgi:hypothetical protein
MALRDRFVENAFFVLGLGRDASRAEVERTGQRLLAELTIGREATLHYDTPLGPQRRTPDRVRQALAELRDPARRILHEAWAQVPVHQGGALERQS